MNNNTDRYFRDRLAEFSQNPPDSNWESIAQKMSRNKKKIPALFLFRIAAGMALITSLGIGIYYINQSGSSQQDQEIAESNATAQASDKRSGNELPVASNLENQKQVSPSFENQKPSSETRENFSQTRSIQPEIVENSTELQFEISLSSSENAELIRSGNAEMNLIASLAPPVMQNQLPEMGFSEFSESNLSQEEAVSLLMAEYNAAFTDDIVEKKPNHRWELGGEIAPLYSDRSISSSSLESSVISNLNEKEEGILAYAGGLRVSFSPARRLSVQSGLYYSKYGQKKNEVLVYNDVATALVSNEVVSITNSTGTIAMTNQGTNRSVMNNSLDESGIKEIMTQSVFSATVPDEVTIKQTFDYFELPLVLKYKMIDRKMDFSLSGGIITNFLIGNKVDMTHDGKSRLIGKTTDINEVNYVGSIGLGIEYPIVPRFALTLEPRFRYYLNNIDQSAQISVHPYSFGFFAGVNYTF